MAGYSRKIVPILFLFFITCVFSSLSCRKRHMESPFVFDWVVIGAGPAGIAALGKLIDNGIRPDKIAWIDPRFSVGRIGRHYHNIPGNAQTKDYIAFIEACNEFKMFPSKSRDALYELDPNVEYELEVVARPLQDITNHLKKKVKTYQGYVSSIKPAPEFWTIINNKGDTIQSKKIVLATGCHPKKLAYPIEHEISLDLALDKEQLASFINPNDTVAVIGGSHSGILVVKNLYELGVSKIINFYKKPLSYSFDTGHGNQIQTTGLAGPVGRWAFETLEQEPPPNIMRLKNCPETRAKWLSQCNKIIYAVGYQRNKVPCDIPVDSYNDKTGVIAPNLYGIGIAFPEGTVNGAGAHEKYIGLKNFMDYAKKVVPKWLVFNAKRTPLMIQRPRYLPIKLHSV